MIRESIAIAIMCLTAAVEAQPTENIYQVEFSSGQFTISATPHHLSADSEASPITLVGKGEILPGIWGSDPNAFSTELEKFALSVFQIHKKMTDIGALSAILDDESYQRRKDIVAENPQLLQSYKNAYARYDEFRLLGYIQYGHYLMLFVQMKDSSNIYPDASPVMPVVKTSTGYRLTDGTGASGDGVFNMLVSGSLHDHLYEYLLLER